MVATTTTRAGRLVRRIGRFLVVGGIAFGIDDGGFVMPLTVTGETA